MGEVARLFASAEGAQQAGASAGWALAALRWLAPQLLPRAKEWIGGLTPGRTLVNVVVGVVLLMVGRCTAPEKVGATFPLVQVDPGHILAREPQITTRVIERLRWRPRPPESVAVAPDGAQIVLEFCRESAEAANPLEQPHGGGSAEVEPIVGHVEPSRFIRSLDYDEPWFFGRARLEIFAVTSAGALEHWDHRVGGSFQARAHRGIAVRESRWWPVKQIARLAVPAALGYGACWAGGKIGWP